MTEKTIAEEIEMQERIESYRTMIEALEKQVPKKPKEDKNMRGDFMYICPACENKLSQITKYCNECGQKLRWKND